MYKKGFLLIIFILFSLCLFMPEDVFAEEVKKICMYNNVIHSDNSEVKLEIYENATHNPSITVNRWNYNENSFPAIISSSTWNVFKTNASNYDCPTFAVIRKCSGCVPNGIRNVEGFMIYVYNTQSDSNQGEERLKGQFGESNVYGTHFTSEIVPTPVPTPTPTDTPNISIGGEPIKQECKDVLGTTDKSESVAWLLQKVLDYAKIAGVLMFIIFSGIELSKAVISSNADALKKSGMKTVYRAAAVLGLFLLPTIINILMGIFISGSITDFTCGLK